MIFERAIDPHCRSCDGPATLRMRHGADDFGLACFPCADEMMRQLAFANVRGGATRAQTVQGYIRWRAHVGRPCTAIEATAALKDL